MAQTGFQEHYNEEFYDELTDGSVNSARVILPLLYNIYQPRSVIDVGCGHGSWLVVAESLGSTTLVGLDGNWVKKEKLLRKNIKFVSINFEDSIDLNRKYDLCISLEVAEHLTANRAKPFVDTLCKASDVVLFGAAIRYQGGTHHVNEQWQSYWGDLFNDNGYSCFDIFRGDVWNNDDVEWWYRQNTFLFVNQGCGLIDLCHLKSLEKTIPDVVHPKNYESKVKYYEFLVNEPTLRFCLGCVKRYVLTKMRKLMASIMASATPAANIPGGRA